MKTKTREGTQWLVSPSFDGIWFIASPLAAVFFYSLFVVSGTSFEKITGTPSVLLFFLIFTGLFDAPHIFTTFSRTHFDEVERKRNFIFHGVTLICALAISLSSVWLQIDELFMTLLGLYGAWHIVKQNVGFVRLYQRLNPQWETTSPKLETTLLLASLPFYYLHGHSDLDELLSSAGLGSTALQILQRISELVLVVLIVQVFIANYRVKKQRGEWNKAKLLVILSSLLLVFWVAILDVHPLMLIALSTIGHDLQYQAWMWTYNRRMSAMKIRPAVVLLVCLGIGGLVALGPEQWAPLYNGFVLWHYFIDGFIWRFGASPELFKMLPTTTKTFEIPEFGDKLKA